MLAVGVPTQGWGIQTRTFSCSRSFNKDLSKTYRGEPDAKMNRLHLFWASWRAGELAFAVGVLPHMHTKKHPLDIEIETDGQKEGNRFHLGIHATHTFLYHLVLQYGKPVPEGFDDQYSKLD